MNETSLTASPMGEINYLIISVQGYLTQDCYEKIEIHITRTSIFVLHSNQTISKLHVEEFIDLCTNRDV